MGTCVSISDEIVYFNEIVYSEESIYNNRLDEDILLIIKKIERIIHTDHTKNEYINEILNLILEEENITDPYGNKNIPDNLYMHAKKIYKRIKNKYIQIINTDIDLLLQTTINDLPRIKVLLKIDIDNQMNVKEFNIKMNRCIHEKIINNIKYYGKYLLKIINNISGLKELNYLGIIRALKPSTNVRLYDNIYINIISTTMLKKITPDTHISLKRVLNKLTRKRVLISSHNHNIFIENIKTIEIIKNKLIFLNKYETKPLKTIIGINDDFLNKLYEEYLENKFDILIIDDFNVYDVGLQYKDL